MFQCPLAGRSDWKLVTLAMARIWEARFSTLSRVDLIGKGYRFSALLTVHSRFSTLSRVDLIGKVKRLNGTGSNVSGFSTLSRVDLIGKAFSEYPTLEEATVFQYPLAGRSDWKGASARLL